VYNGNCNLAKVLEAMFLAFWYQAMQTVTFMGIASSWSSVQVPLFCEHCTKVWANNCIASSSIKLNTNPFRALV
jgi:hypothetical protein